MKKDTSARPPKIFSWRGNEEKNWGGKILRTNTKRGTKGPQEDKKRKIQRTSPREIPNNARIERKRKKQPTTEERKRKKGCWNMHRSKGVYIEVEQKADILIGEKKRKKQIFS